MQSSLPLEIRLIVLGMFATVLLVAGAAALRGPYVGTAVAVARTRPLATSGTAARSATSTRDRPAPAAPAGTSAGAARTAEAPGEAPLLGGDAREARATLTKEVQMGRYSGATEVLARLVDMDPKAAEDNEVRADVVELSMRVMLQTGNDADKVFEMIVKKMGPTGIDILYELMTSHGGSRAAARAEDLLKDAAVRARGTAALRITYDLRASKSCDEKKGLFARAKSDGDRRALGQLQLLTGRCGRRFGGGGGCCFEKDAELRDAIDSLNARLK